MWMPERLKVWQVLFLLFPLFLWMAYSSYVDFTRLEEEGGVLYVGKTTKLLYGLGGKWAVVGFPIVAMGLWGYAVWKTLKLSKKADDLRDHAEDPGRSRPQSQHRRRCVRRARGAREQAASRGAPARTVRPHHTARRVGAARPRPHRRRAARSVRAEVPTLTAPGPRALR